MTTTTPSSHGHGVQSVAPPVTIAVVGASGNTGRMYQAPELISCKGFIGLRHLNHVLQEPLCRLGAIVDVAPAGAELAKRHRCPIYTTIPEMMTAIHSGQLKVDGAILATPTASHVPLGLLLVEAGVHVIIEKPLSVDTASGKELVAAATASGAQILVGHHRRFNPHMREVLQYLPESATG